MTTKKIIVVIVAIVVVLGLIVAIFVGGIVGSIFYGISNSEAANVSREFLRNNALLKQDIGQVKDFGKLVTGNINIDSGDGTAQLSLKVYGERKTVTASVELIYRNGKPWRVTAASYKNDEGQTVDLLNPYETRNSPGARASCSPMRATWHPSGAAPPGTPRCPRSQGLNVIIELAA